MARQKIAPEVLAHLEWLGFVQPTGLVVSAPALVKAGAVLDKRDAQGQLLLRECVVERMLDPIQPPRPCITDFEVFARAVLGWSFSPKYYAGTLEAPLPPELEVALIEFGETLRPDFAVREPESTESGSDWQLLVRVLEPGTDFDHVHKAHGRLETSEHGRMERLLRQTGVLAGLLFDGTALRIISAPRGESSGWLDFRVADMLTTAGRPICTAMRMLLNEQRLLAWERPRRLTALLEDSRKYQNEVSERLAEQVLHALYELLRGFQSAHDASRGELLREPLSTHPDSVYHALLTVLLRLVFLLYAEERGMLPDDEAFVRFYSIAGLHERLRGDAALYPDTMDQRFGAWAHLLALFRIVHDGASAAGMHMPERHGVLFDPDRFPFLEGRSRAGVRQVHERIEPPLVPDGTVYRALEKLLVLDGERISYRALDVEQIGSVYETMMGFRLETAHGASLAIKPQKRLGAPVTIDLTELLATEPAKREKWLADGTDRKASPKVKAAIQEASTLEEVHVALDPLVDRDATPDIVPVAAMVLQPSEERRRSGSHYTPRSLTEPIVRATLGPILQRLKGPEGEPPRVEQILDLKVCDPAMGSGAFLVETCRQLADALIESWACHGGKPEVPVDEDDVVFARRMVAQRCLLGVDRNPVAVDLAKMSLWLVTLAREHPLTFIDHALKHGDSLVGLSVQQVEAFHWDEKQLDKGRRFVALRVREHLEHAAELRERIGIAEDDVTERELEAWLRDAEQELDQVKLAGDLVVAAFFSAAKPKERETGLVVYTEAFERAEADGYRASLEELRHAERPLAPFHWQLEFPEVFERDNPGFDAIAGNPPFAGKNTLAAGNADGYSDWLKQLHPGSHGNADLVAHFFRRTFSLLRAGGALGFIATNTISQGDTRATGLAYICTHGGEIYAARRRVKWPGEAAVVVSVVNVIKGSCEGVRQLDGRGVDTISAFLFHRGGHTDPVPLAASAGKSFIGSYVLGMGFTFDDTDTTGAATSIAEMKRIVSHNPANAEVIFPYLGGEEVNTSPAHAHRRYVINFHGWPRERASTYVDCWDIVEQKVRPERQRRRPDGEFVLRRPLPECYWQYAEKRPGLYAAIAELGRVLAISRVSNSFGFTFLPSGIVYNEKLVIFPFANAAPFTVLQSRPHEVWARFFSTTLKDDLQYTPSDCFETFPFPKDWHDDSALEAPGQAYYEFRADLMVRNDEGLTKTYNRFHDPDEDSADILKLRELHGAMDRAVLDAYGWSDIPTACQFLLDYELDEEEESSRRKKPWRYRWPDDVRDEVLARLLELNAERAAEEARSGAGARKVHVSVRSTSTGAESERLF